MKLALARLRVALPPSGLLGAGVVLMLMTWSPGGAAPSLTPGPGMDPSWSAGITMAVHEGLTFGRDIVFTYGPLGFLKLKVLWFSDTAIAAVVYTVLTHVALCMLLLASLRKSFGAVTAFLLALVVGSVVHDEATAAIAFLWAAWLMTGRSDTAGARQVFAVGSGVLGAVELLAKLNDGVLVLTIAAVAALFLPDRGRLLVLLGGSAAVAFLTLWTTTGQPWGALVDFVRQSARVVSGYSAAMDLEDSFRVWEYGAALLFFVVGAAAILEQRPARARDPRLGLLAIWTVLGFFAFKEGFVRHDDHSTGFFATMLAAFCALQWMPGRRAVGLTVIALGFTAYLGTATARLTDVIEPVPRLRAALHAFADVADASRRSRLQGEGREAIMAAAKLGSADLAALRGRTVHVAPWETTLVWAYGLRWDPLPIFQSYQAYTSGLDRTNAAVLDSRDAPERILYQGGNGLDGRYRPYDSPLATTRMLCRYRPLRRPDVWLVLGHGPSRCGPARLVGSVRAAWDEQVGVPEPTSGGLVLARVAGVRPGVLERVRTLFYKGHDRSITFNGAQTYRLIAAVAGDGLPLRAASGVDLPMGFAVVPQAKTVSVGRAGLGPRIGKPLRFDFYEIRFTAA